MTLERPMFPPHAEHLIDQTVDIFCERLARIDAIGTNRRLIFTTSSLVDGPQYHNVAAKLILPADFMSMLAYMAAGADRKLISPELLALEPRNAN